MTDGGLPASKKLKAADGSSAAAPVVAEDEPSGLLPPSIPVIQSADDLHAVLAETRENASRTKNVRAPEYVRKAARAAFDYDGTEVMPTNHFDAYMGGDALNVGEIRAVIDLLVERS